MKKDISESLKDSQYFAFMNSPFTHDNITSSMELRRSSHLRAYEM